MTGTQEQIFLGDDGRAHTAIPGLKFRFFNEFLDLFDQNAAIRHPERQAGAYFVIEQEYVQFLAQLAVIALLGFLQHLEILLEFINARSRPV